MRYILSIYDVEQTSMVTRKISLHKLFMIFYARHLGKEDILYQFIGEWQLKLKYQRKQENDLRMNVICRPHIEMLFAVSQVFWNRFNFTIVGDP